MMFFVALFISIVVSADVCHDSFHFPSHAEVQSALRRIINDAISGVSPNGGFNINMWATLVDRDGKIKVVTFSGNHRGDQYPGSRLISAQKAYTANAFSLPNFAVSTANLYSAVQPGASLYGLQHSNPVDVSVAYSGNNELIGTPNDPLLFKKIGGINVFGGGLSLFKSDGQIVGALGVSGDSSCADHAVAWKLRAALDLAYVPAGPNPMTGDDNIVYDINNGISGSGWGHPFCGDPNVLNHVLGNLPQVSRIQR